MQDLDQIIQTNNLSNASQSSCAEQHAEHLPRAPPVQREREAHFFFFFYCFPFRI